YIQDCVLKKVKVWKARHLSFAGRSTLIKAVAQAIPTYVMSCFLLPKDLCSHIESMICNFWRGSNNDKRKIHWVRWSLICKHKKKGGLGFRELRAFNEALLAKQGWRCITQPTSMVSQTLKAKYYPKVKFLEAEVGNKNVSYTWRSIQKASWILKKWGLWNVGNGDNINIWKDNWLPRQQGHKLWSPKREATQERVKDLMLPEVRSWNRQLLFNLFLHFEAEQIAQIPIVNLSRPDEFSWPKTKDGEYTVKSGYQALQDWKEEQSNPPTSGSTHK
ncbi:reverse transcriptase-like protein, partial [Trifolium medium]|nr:reverse transcriptase-like protein [Trifolium medium]